jgi:hypothetical protein
MVNIATRRAGTRQRKQQVSKRRQVSKRKQVRMDKQEQQESWRAGVGRRS